MSADPTVLNTQAPVKGRGATIVLPGQSPEGAYILSVLLKRTFEILPGRVCQPAPEDRALLPADVFWDAPNNSSVRFETDFIPYKPGTDVVLNGTVYAPGGAPTTACDVMLSVGGRMRTIVAIGDRKAAFNDGGTPRFTDPTPFTTMDLRYERAYGGTDVYSDPAAALAFPPNPLGRGFVIKNTADALDGLPLPNMEDPTAFLTPEQLCVGDYRQWTTRALPAGFGWVPKTWLPRAQLVGVLPRDRAVEQELRKTYAQLLPPDQREPYMKHGFRDMDFAFFNGASPGFVFESLAPGEAVATENLAPEGQLVFRLPKLTPRLGLDIGSGLELPEVALHTVMIDMDARLVDLVWRAAVPYRGPDWLPKMQKMDVLVTDEES